MTNARLILSSLKLAHALATQRLIGNLDHILEALPTVRPARSQQYTLAQTVLMLEGARTDAHHGKADFRVVNQLRDAMTYLRFVRQPRDEATTDNPMYNVTIWLAEAIACAAEVARTADIIAGAERLGIDQ